MATPLRVWLKKVFSLALVLNSLVTIAAIAGIIAGFYRSFPYWKPYWPYLVNGNMFLLVALAALINIFPSASIGRKLHTGRFLFHHYVYGAVVLATSSFCVVTFSSVSLINLFIINTTDVAINAGRCFVLIGVTLLLDDLPDVSKRIEKALNKLKCGFCRIRKTMYALQLITGLTTLYIFFCILYTSIIENTMTLANIITMSTLMITTLTSLIFFKRQAWLKITPPNTPLDTH